MRKVLDRTGLRYGRLVVIKHEGKNNKGRQIWLCKCDCGNEKIVTGGHLTIGTKSCGCLLKEASDKAIKFIKNPDRQEAMLKDQYSEIKQRIAKGKLIGEIFDFDTFKKLVKSKCHYCGVEYSKEVKDMSYGTIKGGRLISDEILKVNGIDRIDSNIGYTVENSVSCCKTCNFAKNVMSQDDFYSWIKRVYEYNFKQEDLKTT